MPPPTLAPSNGKAECLMDFSAATGWWVAAGIAIAAELGTGTFYLLMIAVGLAAAAVAAHLGLSLPAQMVTGAIVGAGATALWWAYRRRKGSGSDRVAHQNRDVNLDIGEQVNVSAWNADGSATVSYRGAAWQARWLGTGQPSPGPHVIRAVEGNRLLLDR
jgi:membrane protein implicated in regulation of membrane protease activity